MPYKIFSYLTFCMDDLALADASSEQINLQGMFPENMKLEMFKMLGSLILLLTLFGIGVWAFKKFLKSKGQGFGNTSTIKILDRRSLNQKTCIYIIRVVNKILVIAEAGEKITLLSEFPPNTDINELLQQNEKKGPSDTSDFLSKSIRKFHKNKKVDSTQVSNLTDKEF
ncbi:FliO/MopB family protein [Chlamydia crocodili]|uniref:FliO/MopB family protein n=1 Tax=Chlamydia crocodili TaxID=2766982 RepID=A0ABX8CD38_9CHLA|nr:FliO/MopB family protein [Chlamydia crocodili]QVE48930.1 FliO/MopB family protein [Chlamydia crocodili]